MTDKRTTITEMVGTLRSGMTIGFGGWGSRRKPMAVVRAICRSDLQDLTVVSYGGPDVGLLCATGKVARVVCGFVTLDSIALDPHWRAIRQAGNVQLTELDEGMFFAGLQAAAWRIPFIPTRAGLGSDVLAHDASLRTVRSPYIDGPYADPDDVDGGLGVELVAAPALRLDAGFVHANRADHAGNAQILGPDLFFDALFLGASSARRFVTAEAIVEEGKLGDVGPLSSTTLHRLLVDGVAEAPLGAHFTSCPPDYGRDEAFQKAYAAATDEGAWSAFRARYIDVSDDDYRQAIADDATKESVS